MTEAESDDERRAKGLPPEPAQPDGEHADPPRPIQLSFWLWVASGVLFVAGYLLNLVQRGPFIEQVIKANTNPAVTSDQIRSGTTVLFVVFLIGAVSFAGLYTLFAYKARQGTRSARAVLTALMAVTVVFQVVAPYPFRHQLTLIATLVGLVALALMYLPKTTTYFPKVSRKAS